MAYKSFILSKWMKYRVLILSILFISLYSGALIVFATTPALYTPSDQETDPICGPTDAGCYVNNPNASGSTDGLLTSTDWTTFNNKLTAVSVDGVTITGDGTSGNPLVAHGSGAPALTATQIAYGDGSNALTSSSDFTYDPGNSLFNIGFGGNNYFSIDAGTSLYKLGDLSDTDNGATLSVDVGNNLITAGNDTGTFLSLDGNNRLYQIGDVSDYYRNTILSVDDSNQLITASSGGHTFLSLDGINGLYQIGDINADYTLAFDAEHDSFSAILGGTSYLTVDAGSDLYQLGDPSNGFLSFDGNTFTTNLNGGNPYISLDHGTYLYQIGDISSVDNATTFSVDDANQKYIFNKPNFSIAGVDYVWPGSQATESDVLINDGSGNLSWQSIPGGSLIGQTSSSGTQTWLGEGAGSSSANKLHTVLLGYYAGAGATTSGNIVAIGNAAASNASNAASLVAIGNGAGGSATNATYSIFLGKSAGASATNADYSIFLGQSAGDGATGAYNSFFVGNQAGQSATGAAISQFIGNGAGGVATNASGSEFIGNQAGQGATNAKSSIFIGVQSGYYDTVNNTASGTSILIGDNTLTGGYQNSIAIGKSATNSAANQFKIGSTTSGIESTVIQGASSSCTITTGTGIACSSDERLKTNITDLNTNILDNLLKLRTVTYNWNSNPDGPQMIGFLAQDLEQYYPELVSTAQMATRVCTTHKLLLFLLKPSVNLI